MSRINLENNLTYRQRMLGPEFYSTRHVLTGSYVLTPESTTYQFLNPNGADRTVFLPEITQGGQFYVIGNDGGSGALDIVDADGLPVVTLEVGDLCMFFSSQSEWWIVIGMLAALLQTITTFSLTFIIDGGGAVITTGVKGDLEVPFDCTLQQVTLLADQSGSIVVDIWKDTYANFPPVVGDSITAAAKPTISADDQSKDSTLTGWTTSVVAGDTLRFNVNSASSVTRVTVSLKCQKV